MPLVHSVSTATAPDRQANEDRCLADPARGLFAVVDGRGSAGLGTEAAKVACHALQEAFSVGARLNGTAHTVLEHGLHKANEAVYQLSRRSAGAESAAATVVAAAFDGQRVTIGHVGDCRAYLYREGRLQPATTDHTLIMEQVRQGLISVEEARQSQEKHVTLRSLGSEAVVSPDVSTFELRNRDILLLCSDGLTDFIDDVFLARTLERHGDQLDAACADLLSQTATAGCRDDATVLLVQVRLQKGRPLAAAVDDGHGAGDRLAYAVLVSALLFVLATMAGGYWLLQRAPSAASPGRAMETSTTIAAATQEQAPSLFVVAPTSSPEPEVPAPEASPTPTAVPPRTATFTPIAHRVVRALVDELRTLLTLPVEERAAFLRQQTTQGWGHTFANGTHLKTPFALPPTETYISQRVWRGNKGAEYLIELVYPDRVEAFVAFLDPGDGRWTVAIHPAPPTPTPTQTRTPRPTVSLALDSPTKTATPSLTPTPSPWSTLDPAVELPPAEAARIALSGFIERDLAAALARSTDEDLKPALDLFSPQVAAQQYRYYTREEERSQQSQLSDILRRYVDSSAPAKPIFLGLSGTRSSAARARAVFAVRYNLPRSGDYEGVYDIHDVDIERETDRYRVVRIFRYQFAVESLPKFDQIP